MVEYICTDCTGKFNKKSDYERHLNRMTKCNKNEIYP